jgi:hypothetical protein
MIQVTEEQIWDASTVGTAIFDVIALLIGSAVIAFLLALLTIWLIVELLKKIDPKFSESVEAWRPPLAFGGAVFAGALVFLQVAVYVIIRFL